MDLSNINKAMTEISKPEMFKHGPFHLTMINTKHNILGKDPKFPTKLTADLVNTSTSMIGKVSPCSYVPQVVAFRGHLGREENGLEFYTAIAVDDKCPKHIARWTGEQPRKGLVLLNNLAQLDIWISRANPSPINN
eukprot:UN30885